MSTTTDTPAKRATPTPDRALAAQLRAEQGLPPTVQSPAVLARIARILTTR